MHPVLSLRCTAIVSTHPSHACWSAGGLSSGRIDHVARIPRRSIARRLGRLGSLATSAGQALADVFSRSADLIAIGGIINGYASLESPVSSHEE